MSCAYYFSVPFESRIFSFFVEKSETKRAIITQTEFTIVLLANPYQIVVLYRLKKILILCTLSDVCTGCSKIIFTSTFKRHVVQMNLSYKVPINHFIDIRCGK